MIKTYANNGGDEKKMWASVDVTGEAMEYIKEADPEKYECLMRKLSEALYGKHYSEELARADVEKMHHTGKDGVAHHGAHWSPEEVEAAMSDKTFGKSITKWDKFVAANFTHSLLAGEFDDSQIIAATYLLFYGNDNSMNIWDIFAK